MGAEVLDPIQNESIPIGLPLIAILRGVRPDEAREVAIAVANTRIRMIEVPMNSPDPLTSIHTLSKLQHPGLIVGAGTVMSVDEVDAVADAGGQLVVSPNTDEAVIRRSKARHLISMPGCMTPTEAFVAIQAGADGLKLFPGEIVTPDAVRALKAVLPSTILLFVVGGVGVDNMSDYLQAGADGFGIGSSMYRPGKSVQDVDRDARAIVDRYESLAGK